MKDPQNPDDSATEVERKRYNRVAPFYDLNVALLEWFGLRRWRRLLWSKVEGQRVLEVGIGTGLSIPYYPPGVEITGIDLSDNMLKRARARASKRGANVDISQMDVQRLTFEDDSFDAVVASLVFCSVPDPIKGLAEVRRVLRPGGKVVMLEHVISGNRVMGWIMNAFNPVALWIGGENINRRTVQNAEKAGLTIEKVTNLGRSGIFKLIEARKDQR